VAPLVLLVLAAVSGCTAEATSSETHTPFATCATLTGGLARSVPSGSVSSGSASSGSALSGSVSSGSALSGSVPSGSALSGSVPSGSVSSGSVSSGGSASSGGSSAAPTGLAGLPDLRLPCFTGGAVVALRDVRGPAVINMWASWCDPCRRELPVMQRLAAAAGDRLTVVGVDTGDRREAGASFAADKGVDFPTLFDQDSKLLAAVRRINLPATVFVDGSGRASLYDLPLDAAKLTEMVRVHTGVTVKL
jgi:thiol-disulfide isomerase/thioredoxin